MNFNTALFLFLFLPFFLIAYLIAQPRWRPVIGIIASLVFYAWGEPISLIAILSLLIVNYFLAFLLGTKSRGRWLVAGLLINIGGLVFYKIFTAYGAGFFFGFSEWMMVRLPEWFVSMPFPLGLSYISFQLISYLIDVYSGKVTPERDFTSFAFYVLMFPKLLVGPIVRCSSISSQLPAPTLDKTQIADGIRRFLQGFAKKILIADTLARTVDVVFALPVGALTPTYAWLGLVGYTLQIYFDFSGYTDMAIGLAGMMGFRFVENFNYPYLSQGIGDFWRRWHISLSTWFRDYVFFPLERRRVPVFGQSLNVLIVFLLTGLWHGLAVSFVVWGLIHGLFIVFENMFLNRWLAKLPRVVRHIYALSVVMLAWLVFRAPTFEYAREFLFLLFGGSQDLIQLSFNETSPLPFIEPSFIIALAAGVIFSLPIGSFLQTRANDSFPVAVVRDFALIACFILAIGVMTTSGFLPGIYANF